MSIILNNFLEGTENRKIIKCDILSNDMIFMKYDVSIGNVVEVSDNEYVILIYKGEIFDIKKQKGKYIIESKIADNELSDDWKELHIRKTENDELCVIFLNNNVITNNKYFINDPIKYVDFSNEASDVLIKLEGNYDFRIENPKEFLGKIIGLRKRFPKQELVEKIRKYVLKSIEEGINEISQEYKLNVNDLPENSKQLEIKLKQNKYDDKLLEYGVKLTYFDINKLEIIKKKFKFF